MRSPWLLYSQTSSTTTVNPTGTGSKREKKVFKHKGLKKPKNNYLISGPMKVHTVLDSIVLIIKSKLIKGSTSSDIAQAAKLLPRGHPQVSVSEGFCPRLKKILLSCSRVFGEPWQGPDKPISCSIILQSCSTLFADTHMPPCSFT